MASDRAELLSRIRKLWQLGASANADVADSSRAEARVLMEKHGVTFDELGAIPQEDAPGELAAGSDPSPYAPDLERGALRWPRIVGIISISWGSLGLLCNGCGGVWLFMAPQFMKMAEQQMGGPAPAVLMPTIGQFIVMGIGALWTILLLVAGISTASRKPVARPLHLTYAIGGILLALIGAGLGFKQQLDIAAWVQANPGNAWAQQQKPGLGMAITAFVTILGLAWPVFCLAWFVPAKRAGELAIHDRVI